MRPTEEYELQRRTGGKKLHPKTEETFKEPTPPLMPRIWSYIKDHFSWYFIIVPLVFIFAWGLVNRLPDINITNPFTETKIVERIVEVPIPVIKYVTRYVNKYVENPINAELRESNRILTDKIKSLNYQYRINKKIVDDFYRLKLKKGYRKYLSYKSGC